MTYFHAILHTEAPGQGENQDGPGELDLIFKVTKAIQSGFRSISEEIVDVSSPDLVHISTRARRTEFELGDFDQIF